MTLRLVKRQLVSLYENSIEVLIIATLPFLLNNFPPKFLLKILRIQRVDNKRLQHMEEILNKYKKPIRALEIGTFFGDNSTQSLLEHLPARSELFLLDSWQRYREGHNLNEDKHARKMDSLLHLGYLSTIRNVSSKLSSKREVKVTIIRGKSSNILKLLASNTFDFIYIDGSHYYSDVKVDLQNSLRIINQKFGIICGDDLERKPTLSNMTLASKHRDKDFYQDFHPGVLLAVGEVIGSVNMKDGFWWIFVTEGKVTLQ